MASGVREIVRNFNAGSSEGNPGTVEVMAGAGTLATDLFVVVNHAYGGPASAMLAPTPGTWTLAGVGRNDATDNPHTKVWVRPAGSAGSQTVTTNHTGTGFSASQQHAHLFVLSGSDTSSPIPTGGFAAATGFAAAQDAPSATGVADGLKICTWISDDTVNYSSGMNGGGETDSGSSTAYSGWEATAGGATGTETATVASGKTFNAVTTTIAPAAASTPEVTTSVPLGVAVSAASSVGHEAGTSIPLQVALGAASSVGHEVGSSVPLGVAVSAVTQTPGVSNVTASIPLGVAVSAVSVVDRQVGTSIPLQVALGAASSDPDPGRPVAPFPGTTSAVKSFLAGRTVKPFPDTPRPVRSFSEVPSS